MQSCARLEQGWSLPQRIIVDLPTQVGQGGIRQEEGRGDGKGVGIRQNRDATGTDWVQEGEGLVVAVGTESKPTSRTQLFSFGQVAQVHMDLRQRIG